MPLLDFPAFDRHLKAFAFTPLFVDVLGWNHAPAGGAWVQDAAGESGKALHFERRAIAELGGVMVVQAVVPGGLPDEPERLRIWRKVSQDYAENLLIFTEAQQKPSQSLWYWVKRDKHPESGKPKLVSRRHEYFAGQPVDLFASKLQAMVVELSELDGDGRMPVLEAARRIASALDVDRTTKKFFAGYQQQHLSLLGQIEGIDNERDRRWYASVLLNRLMFVWFLQKKGFLSLPVPQAKNQPLPNPADYLREALTASKQKGDNRFFGEFLKALFFEAFAKPESERSAQAKALTGRIPYLNGGLFLPHKLELDSQNALRVGETLRVPDSAFAGVFDLFASFSWHLDDTPGGNADEVNPDVLGYIFEKYINQKAFGAYYTRPEITNYLAERSIHKLILERIYEPAAPELRLKEVKFTSVADMLARMDTRTAQKLVAEVLPSISILDPAVGSGAFLVAALKCLVNVYYAVVGRAELGASSELQAWLRHIQKEHPSVGYYIKRRIVTDNLYGVDIMEEACEIAKLRLFLAMVSSVRQVEDLEPLPNIDFNILPGNSLVGYMRVDAQGFDTKSTSMTQMSLFAETKSRPFRQLLADKNRKLDTYRNAAEMLGPQASLRQLRDDIDTEMRDANAVLNEMVRDEFEKLGIRFEQATWDAGKKTLGKPAKRPVERADIDAQHPFHWGYVFDKLMQERGGFDIILANPPWEVFQTDEKEFFQQYDKAIQKNKLRIEDWGKQFNLHMSKPDVRAAWLEYVSRFPHMAKWYKQSSDYSNQTAIKINLYLLFIERCFHLLRASGHCGIVIPSGIYTDLGAKGLRDMLFGQTQIEGLFCFENRKTIFEGVDSRFKFVVLTFEKSATPRLRVAGERNASAAPQDLLAPEVVQAAGGGGTLRFPAAFMRQDVAELDRFPQEGALWLEVDLIRRLSPDSHSIMEFKSAVDVQIAEKMLKFPLLGERIEGAWNLKLCQEFNMTTDSHLFKTEPGPGRLPLYEGKMIHQYSSYHSPPKYWIDVEDAKKALKSQAAEDHFDFLDYRLAFREIARDTDVRTLIATLLPKRVFVNHKLMVERRANRLASRTQCYVLGVQNSLVFDYLLRKRVNASVSMYVFYQIPMPRYKDSDGSIGGIAIRAARLVCTTREFDGLAESVGLKGHKDGITDDTLRGLLRSEIDGLVAHLYGLSEDEFAHVLTAFPLVEKSVKDAALQAYRDVAKGLVK